MDRLIEKCNQLVVFIPDKQIRAAMRKFIENKDFMTARMLARELKFNYEEYDFIEKITELHKNLKQLEEWK
jgi:hypothetical protein